MENADNLPLVEGEVSPENSEVDTQSTQPDAVEQKVPLHVVAEQRKKKRAETERADAAERKLAAYELQAEQAKLAVPAPPVQDLTPPHPDDYFDDMDGWIKANREHSDASKAQTLAELRETTAKEQQQREQREQGQAQLASQQQRSAELDSKLFEEAEKLNAPDFMDAYDAVTSKLDRWFIDEVLDTFPNSADIVYALGNDEAKFDELIGIYNTSNFKGMAELNKFSTQLMSNKKTTGGNLPEPDEPIKGGAGGIQDVEARIVKLRAKKLAGEIDQTTLLNEMRKLRGWKSA